MWVSAFCQPRQLVDRLARHEHAYRLAELERVLAPRVREPMAIGGHHCNALLVENQERPREVVAGILGRDRKARPRDQLAEQLRGDLDALALARLGQRREILLRQAGHLVDDALALDRRPAIRQDLDVYVAFRERPCDLVELLGPERDGARVRDLCRTPATQRDIQVRGGDLYPTLSRFDQDVRQDRNGVLPLDEALHEVKLLNQVIPSDDDLHAG